MKMLLILTILSSISSTIYAEEMQPLGLQCSGVSSADVKACLKKESGKIDEAARPNEIIISSEAEGKTALINLVLEYVKNKTDVHAQEVVNKIPMIESAVATAVIVQYETEPQLYYYVVDKDGKLEVIFDGLNSVDLANIFSELFKTDLEIFSLKSPVASKEFKDWLIYLKTENKL